MDVKRVLNTDDKLWVHDSVQQSVRFSAKIDTQLVRFPSSVESIAAQKSPCFSPHQCGVFVFFACIPPVSRPPPVRRASVTSHTQLISHNSSHTTHLTQLISHTNHLTQLITHNSSHTTHLTQLTSHNSSLTQLISHTTHLTQLISHNSSHTTHLLHLTHHSSHTQLISHGAVHKAS